MRRLLLGGWLALLLLALGVSAAAADELDDGVRRIAKQLRCPICESVSVADSPAELAVQMRALIRKKLAAGETDQQIVDFFVAAYGDTVLLEPPRRGLGWAVWLGPLVALAGGGIILWLVLRLWVRPTRDLPAALPAGTAIDARPEVEAPYAAGVRHELDAVRKGLGG